MRMFLTIFLCCFAASLAANYSFYDANGKKILNKEFDSQNPRVEVGSLQKDVAKPVYIKNAGSKLKYGIKFDRHLGKRDIDLASAETADTVWIEAEKNECLNLCIEEHVCQIVQAPSRVSVYSIVVRDSAEENSNLTVNIAVGMKYLDLKGQRLKIGYNAPKSKMRYLDERGAEIKDEDPERLVERNSVYLVDKYPVTNCEFYTLMKDEIPKSVRFENGRRKNIAKMWNERVGRMDGTCVANDSAANSIYLYQALIYANKRSIAEGLEPYYIITPTDEKDIQVWADSSFTVYNSDLPVMDKGILKVSVNGKSNGYRLPYYDEWMLLARGGNNENRAPWGDSSVTVEDVLKYAWFGDSTSAMNYASKPVGMLKSNGYGLYDVFGLVEEFVLFPGKNPFETMKGVPSCLKGGNFRVLLSLGLNEMYIDPYWKWIDYGYSKANYGYQSGGFRLVRKIR